MVASGSASAPPQNVHSLISMQFISIFCNQCAKQGHELIYFNFNILTASKQGAKHWHGQAGFGSEAASGELPRSTKWLDWSSDVFYMPNMTDLTSNFCFYYFEAKKQRTIQVMDIHEIPKPRNGFISKKGNFQGRYNRWFPLACQKSSLVFFYNISECIAFCFKSAVD